MSDLAPSVAAAIRDKVVKELQEENNQNDNERLRNVTQELVNFADLVTVTGSGGSPIYCCGRKDTTIEYDNPITWNDAVEQISLDSPALLRFGTARVRSGRSPTPKYTLEMEHFGCGNAS